MIPELAALPRGEALFDMDGTLLDGDIGESTCRILQESGRFTPEMDAAFGGAGWERYRQIAPVDQAIVCGEALAGRAVGEIEAIVDRAFAEGRVTPRAAVCELAAWTALHHRVWVLSGSAEVVVRAAAARVGIRHVIGLRVGFTGAVLTGRVERPVPTDEGKIRVSWWRTGRRPSFAIGDSPWDLPLLRTAMVARTTGRIAGVEFPAYP